MTSYTAISPSAVSDYTSLSPSIVPQVWDKVVQEGVKLKEWLSKFQGEGTENVICERSDVLKNAGDTFNLTVEAELVGDRVQGSTAAVGAEEKLTLGTYSVYIDFQRHSTAVDRKFTAFRGAKAKATMADKLIGWMARFKQEDALMSLVKASMTTNGTNYNTLYSGGGSTEDTLTTTTVLDTSVFEQSRTRLASLGATPANLGRAENGDDLPNYVMWATTRALSGLDNDTFWNNAGINMRGRENGADKDNPLITGSYGKWKGIMAYELPVPDHDNPAKGAIGTPLEPRAFLRTAITSSTTVAWTFGGSSGSGTSILYTKFIPGYDYLFYASQTAATDTNMYYLRIYNVSGTDAGKSEVVNYQGSNNTGNAITIANRNVIDLGDNGTTSHPTNSVVVPCTSTGIPYAFVPVLGRCALIRCYGEHKEKIDYEEQDYGFIRGGCISAVFGQAAAQRADGLYPNFVMVKVAIDPLS